jgi:Mrp family chromosome partitioning ATPase
VDTDQIKGWKSQLENLDARLAGVQDIGITPASTMLSEIRMKMFDLQLQEIALDNKIQYLQNADANDISDFTVISEAQIPSRPYRSNRRMIFMACVLLATGLGFGTMVALEMLDSTIKSLGELRIKFREPILGNVPHVKVWHQIFSGLIPLPYESRLGIEHPESSIMEPFRIIARHLRGSVPGRGARILVVSAHHGEGKSLASVYLASCMGRQDERVLVMDAFVRADVHQERFSGSSRKIGSTNTLLRQVETILMEPIRSIFGRGRGYHEGQGNSLADRLYRWAGRVSRRQPSTGGDDTRLILRDLIPDNEKNLKGLGEYLSFHADELEEITWPTVLSGVDCLPHIGKAVIPELLGSNRMKQLMETMLERYSVILIDGPPVLPYVDAELIAQQCDAVVLVVRSQWCQLGMVQKAMERLKRLNVPIAGLILNDVDALYLET